MIYSSEAVIEDDDQENGDDQTEETAFVIITKKMQAAFSAVFSLLMTWVCVDSACNVNLMNFLPDGHQLPRSNLSKWNKHCRKGWTSESQGHIYLGEHGWHQVLSRCTS